MSVTHSASGESITAFDGQGGWLGSTGRPARDMSGQEAEAARLDADFYFASHIKEIFSGFRVGRPDKDRRQSRLHVNLHAAGPASGAAVLRPVVRPVAAAGALWRYARWAQSYADRLRRLSRGGWRQGAVPLDVGARQWALHDSDPGSRQNVPIDDAKFAKPAAPAN